MKQMKLSLDDIKRMSSRYCLNYHGEARFSFSCDNDLYKAADFFRVKFNFGHPVEVDNYGDRFIRVDLDSLKLKKRRDFDE